MLWRRDDSDDARISDQERIHREGRRDARRALSAALLGFFIITLDALVVSVALPAIRDDLGGGLQGLQWVMDGYTLPFAALLLLAGVLSDRMGARRAFGAGLVLFTLSSGACALAPSLAALVAARLAQGAGAALMTPASLALIAEAFPNPREKARAIGVWAVGGAVASASGPLVGGALVTLGWPLIFLINLPIGAVALWLLRGVPASQRRQAPLDKVGQVLSLASLSALTYGLIEAGEEGFTPWVTGVLVAALVAALGFLAQQSRVARPMVPLSLLRRPTAALPIAIGFTFMAGFFGMVFLISLFLQEQRGLTPFETGLAFVPVTAFSIFMPMIAARVAERWGAWVPIALGQLLMAVGLFGLSAQANSASVWELVAWMAPVGIGGGTAMPSATSLLLNNVPADRSGTASGVLNTSRQVGGALSIAAFGALVTALGMARGLTASFAVAGALLTLTALASLWLRRATQEAP
jgi:DHA2 family methylenomycin A resistance protein-like MFS transporter